MTARKDRAPQFTVAEDLATVVRRGAPQKVLARAGAAHQRQKALSYRSRARFHSRTSCRGYQRFSEGTVGKCRRR